MENKSFLIKACDFVVRYGVYSAIFLTPLFFLPWTSDVLEFNKQAILLLLLLVSLFAWMLKTLVEGRIEANNFTFRGLGVFNIAVIFLFVASLGSTLFSVFPQGSFWGWPQITSESLLTIICLCIAYFLISNLFSKSNIFAAVLVMGVSAVLAQLAGALNLMGLFFMPFNFAKTTAFNTVGTVGGFGLVSAVLLPLATVMLVVSKKFWKLLFALQIVLSLAIFILINFPIVWWAVLAGSASLMAFAIMKRGVFDARWMAIPMFFTTISLFFILLNPQIGWIPHSNNEVFLSQSSNLKISLNSLRENPVFGSGLGTFGYDFSKFKDVDFFKTPIWNVNFARATSKVLGSLATGGIAGFIAALAMVAVPVFWGLKYAVKSKAKEDGDFIHLALGIGLCAVIISQSVSFFLYNSSISLEFIYFFALAALAGIASQEKKVFELKPSSLATLITTFAFTLVFIFGLGILALNAQRYIAETNYYKGLVLLASGELEKGAGKVERAAAGNTSSDLYYRQLSQIYLAILQQELQKPSLADKDKESAKVQALVQGAINSGKAATDINPKNSAAWAGRGYVYQNLIGAVPDADKWAISSYDEALKLAPGDPYLLMQEGNVYYIAKQYEKAKENLEKSVTLAPNYSNAMFSLGLVYDATGQDSKAIGQFEKIQQLNPQNKDIPTIISNIKAGRPALQSASAPANTPPETEPETPVKNP